MFLNIESSHGVEELRHDYNQPICIIWFKGSSASQSREELQRSCSSSITHQHNITNVSQRQCFGSSPRCLRKIPEKKNLSKDCKPRRNKQKQRFQKKQGKMSLAKKHWTGKPSK
ncbi:hypothetical protein PoB_007608300 [Plakobranchus ocellatus]|uniref:Uncharacterized protein n=1 Tax=Plakobranchus ocellatus TaxID=259542 RepID=A0AAV4DZ76_9GAST|nr:hypothetical protein PoB_007608300 [Plakobranchus ocellatus]